MGKFKILSILLVAMFVLIACGDSKESTNEKDQDSNGGTVGVNSTETKEETKKELTHNYPYFDLKMTYANGDSLTVYFDYNDDVSKTVYESTSKTTADFTGEEAYDQLQPILEKFTFTETNFYPSIASEVLKNFDINNGWQTFELNVKFADGTENVITN